jgi:phage tail protein X
MNYVVKYGESIRDVCLNATGSINSWESILNLNGFTDWTPTLSVGDEIVIPDIIDTDVYKTQQLYPANNAPDIPDLLTKILTFTDILDSATINEYTPANVTQSFINYYTIRENETIKDVCLNSTGTIDNWESILNANNFTEWVPSLSVGQKIIIPPNAEIQNNVLMITTKYPSNNSPDISNFDALVNDFISNFGNYWILQSSYWDDGGVWEDSNKWID